MSQLTARNEVESCGRSKQAMQQQLVRMLDTLKKEVKPEPL